MNVCPGEGVAYDSYYNETDRVSMFYIIDCFPGWLFNIGSFCSQGGLQLKSQ